MAVVERAARPGMSEFSPAASGGEDDREQTQVGLEVLRSPDAHGSRLRAQPPGRVSFGGGSCAPDWRDDKSLVT
jgi:hypothetical protein